MAKRVRGKDNRGKYYFGLPICNRKEFYKWANNQSNLITLYKGYTLDNIRFVTFSENSRGVKQPFRT